MVIVSTKHPGSFSKPQWWSSSLPNIQGYSQDLNDGHRLYQTSRVILKTPMMVIVSPKHPELFSRPQWWSSSPPNIYLFAHFSLKCVNRSGWNIWYTKLKFHCWLITHWHFHGPRAVKIWAYPLRVPVHSISVQSVLDRMQLASDLASDLGAERGPLSLQMDSLDERSRIILSQSSVPSMCLKNGNYFVLNSSRLQETVLTKTQAPCMLQ